MIFRSHDETNYTIISNDLANDSSISFEARGVLMYLLSKPKDWIVRTADLINASQAGKAKVNRIINELIEAGYMVRQQRRNPDGSFSTQEIHVYGSPQTDYRETAKRVPVNQPLQSNERKQNIDNTNEVFPPTPPNEVSEIPIELFGNPFQDAWKDWNEHRKQLRKKQTPISRKKQLKKLAVMGTKRAIAAIEHSIANGYQGIYEPKTNRSGSSQPKTFDQIRRANNEAVIARALQDISNE